MYQSLATVNVANFVTAKLSAKRDFSNYFSWRLQMLRLIESQDLLGFINGEIEAPAGRPDRTESESAYDLWRTDKVLKAWILAAISDPGLPKADLPTAREVWLDLETRFHRRGIYTEDN